MKSMQALSVKISSLKNNTGQIEGLPKNPRLIRDEKFAKLKKSLEDDPEMMQLREVIAYDNNGELVVICGNMRLRALKDLGVKEVPVKVLPTDTPIEKLKAYTIKDNVPFGEHDWSDLANEWDAELLEEWGLDVPNFDGVELEAEEDDFDVPEGGIETDIVLGDLFEIGEHRLLCGDSTDSDAVAKLMDGEKADMVFTDPPYGIKVVKSEMVGADFGVAKKGKYSEVIADDTTDTAREFYDTCVALGMERFIIWGGNYFTDFLPFSDGWLIWNKRAGTDIRNTFADGEMAWCSFHTPIRIYDQLWNGMIREGEKDKRVHPTQKPIRMLSEIIQDHVKGNLLFDGFLGSGSTMVAAHQLKRKCYGMELDPKYCQVIIDRMLKLDPSLEVKRNGQRYTPKQA
jgi:DNA modification methylase